MSITNKYKYKYKTASNISTVSVHIPQSSEDSPLPALLPLTAFCRACTVTLSFSDSLIAHVIILYVCLYVCYTITFKSLDVENNLTNYN